MRKNILLFSLIILIARNSYATHMRAGEITYRWVSGLTYEATILTYTYTPSLADRPQYDLSWGDGTTSIIPRSQKIYLPDDITKNIYVGTHTYPSPNAYTISLEDPNRNGGIINIPNSINVPFFICSMLHVYDPANYCVVNSPTFFSSAPFIKQANDTNFRFNLTTFDIDNDSISYELVPCKGYDGLDIPGYFIPAGVTLDSYNGEFCWNAICAQGEYCFAANIKKWRNGINVGYVHKDFEIDVPSWPSIFYSFSGTDSLLTDNHGDYYITLNPDDTLNLQITFSDANLTHQTSIYSFSEIYQLNNPATYTADSTANISNGYYHWIPSFENGRKHPYLVTFRGFTMSNMKISSDLSLFIYVIGTNDTLCQTIPFSINENNDYSNHLNIYPNPATNTLNIEAPSASEIEILNIQGQLIKRIAANEDHTSVEVSDFANGLYFIKVKTENGVGVKKFVKE